MSQNKSPDSPEEILPESEIAEDEPEPTQMEPYMDEPFSQPRRFRFMHKEKDRQTNCDQLFGELLADKNCNIEEFSKQNNVKILGLKEIHHQGIHNKEDIRFELKILDQFGQKQTVDVNRDTAKRWVDHNTENLKEPLYKGNRNVYFWKNNIFKEVA